MKNQDKVFLLEVPKKRVGIKIIFPFYSSYDEISRIIIEGDIKRKIKQVIVIYES